jgi:transcriptional regulator with XRE-family HTH domain
VSIDLIERIKLAKTHLGHKSDASFADKIEVDRSNFSQMMRGKRPIGDAIINKICIHTTISKPWLLTGEGEMLRVSENKSETEGSRENAVPIHISDISVTIAPLIGQYAQAGYLNGYADPEYIENQPIYYAIKKYSGGNYVAFEVRGDSMDNGLRNAICTGDIILGRELYKDYWLSKLHIPRIFIIVHEDGICCKEIIDHDVENGIITCHSYNPDKNRYPDYQVHLKNVRQLFYMKELRRGND